MLQIQRIGYRNSNRDALFCVKLPNADLATIPDEKLINYLLDEEHPVGGPKARFFRGLGFTSDAPELLREALLLVARTGEADPAPSPYGTKYVVEGLIGSGKRTARVRTVWLIESGREAPQFVTAYPV